MGLHNKEEGRPPEERAEESDHRSGARDLDIDTLFALLAISQRRTVLRYFDGQNPEPVDVACLAQFVYEAEYEPEASVTKADIHTALHHTHLPKLAEAGVIDYDTAKQTVGYHGSNQVEKVLAVAENL